MTDMRDGTNSHETTAATTEHARQIVRQAEHEVEREAWNVHCIEHAAKVAEEQGAKNRARAVEAREALAAKQAALGAIRAQFPEVEPEEVDLHGVE